MQLSHQSARESRAGRDLLQTLKDVIASVNRATGERPEDHPSPGSWPRSGSRAQGRPADL